MYAIRSYYGMQGGEVVIEVADNGPGRDELRQPQPAVAGRDGEDDRDPPRLGPALVLLRDRGPLVRQTRAAGRRLERQRGALHHLLGQLQRPSYNFV